MAEFSQWEVVTIQTGHPVAICQTQVLFHKQPPLLVNCASATLFLVLLPLDGAEGALLLLGELLLQDVVVVVDGGGRGGDAVRLDDVDAAAVVVVLDAVHVRPDLDHRLHRHGVADDALEVLLVVDGGRAGPLNHGQLPPLPPLHGRVLVVVAAQDVGDGGGGGPRRESLLPGNVQC